MAGMYAQRKAGIMDEPFADWLMDKLVEIKKQPSDLARALGVGTSTVSNWTRVVKGKMPNPYYSRAIAKFLGVPAKEVLLRAGHAEEIVIEEEPARQYRTRPRNAADDERRARLAEQMRKLREDMERIERELRDEGYAGSA
jgi:transcriptional regulator with XRE-family HTH domain